MTDFSAPSQAAAFARSAFGPDTVFETEEGPLPAEWIVAGHSVWTRDNGFCRVVSTGAIEVGRGEGPVAVVIPAGAFGHGLPGEPAMVGPDHVVLVRDPAIELYFALPEVFVRARDLIGSAGIVGVPVRPDFAFLQIVFADPQVVETLGLISAAPDSAGRLPRGMVLDAAEARVVRDALGGAAEELRKSA